MAKHIGIVACTAEGAALCYRTICSEAAALLGRNAHPEVSMHTHSFARYVACLERSNLDGVADLMLSSAGKLVSIGATVLICPDNAVHQAFPMVAARSKAQWLDIAEIVTHQASSCRFRKVGVIGTQWLVRSDVYPERLRAAGIDFLRPNDQDIAATDRIIFEELVNGVFHPASIALLRGVIQRLAQGGCDAVVLGCTELPLVLSDLNSALPTLDSTRLLARAALRAALD